MWPHIFVQIEQIFHLMELLRFHLIVRSYDAVQRNSRVKLAMLVFLPAEIHPF